MSKQSDYQAPMVEADKKIKNVWKRLKRDVEVLIHGLLPHRPAEAPKKTFDKSYITSDEDYLYQTAFEMYKESSERISGLEEKGFKLLTYISAVSAVLIYFLGSEVSGIFRFFVVTSLFLLVIAIIMSFRCIGVKTQRAIYIDTLFVFDEKAGPKTKDKKSVIVEIIGCAVFNQTVADNTADTLRACRIMLSLGILMTIISCTFFLTNTDKKGDKTYNASVTFADSTIFNNLAEKERVKDTLLKEMSEKILFLERHVDSLQSNKSRF